MSRRRHLSTNTAYVQRIPVIFLKSFFEKIPRPYVRLECPFSNCVLGLVKHLNKEIAVYWRFAIRQKLMLWIKMQRHQELRISMPGSNIRSHSFGLSDSAGITLPRITGLILNPSVRGPIDPWRLKQNRKKTWEVGRAALLGRRNADYWKIPLDRISQERHTWRRNEWLVNAVAAVESTQKTTRYFFCLNSKKKDRLRRLLFGLLNAMFSSSSLLWCPVHMLLITLLKTILHRKSWFGL